MKLNKTIDKLYTEKVGEFLAKGYRINSASMSSSGEWGNIEGEGRKRGGSYSVKAKIDLTNDREFIRVAIVDRSYYDEAKRTRNVEVLSAPWKGRKDDFWTCKCTTIWCYEFFEVRGDFYGSEAQAEHARAVRKARAKRAFDSIDPMNEYVDLTSPLAKAYVLPFVQRQRGFKTATMKDIERVYKAVNHYQGRDIVSYRVEAKGKYLTLNSR